MSRLGIATQDTQRLSTGGSGAKVYATKEMVVKSVDCRRGDDPSLYKLGLKEHSFYKNAPSLPFEHLPDVLSIEEIEEAHLVFGLRRHQSLSIREWSAEHQQMAADICG